MVLPDFASLLGMAQNILGGGTVMGKLGDYPFFMNRNHNKEISRNRKATFSSYQPIKGQKLLGDSGGTTQDITLNGILVAEPNDALVGLENMLITREPIRFTTIDHDFEVVIINLNIVESNFYIDGHSRVSKYNLQLEEVYGEIV